MVLTTAVAAAGAAAGTVALAACGDGDAGSKAAGSQPPSTAPGTVVAALADVSVGQAKSVTVNGHPAIVTRRSDHDAVAFSAICTHEGCTLVPSGEDLNCPCHRSQFNALTGAVQRGPAKAPLSAIPVKVDNGKIVTT
ncbi:iron-sulfur protein [Amycolatopsis taiwanensis]|uniref:Cytochrome bc1 complex Rieske iron-sulfur subunit n=2 Tax=Amycolatopsis taiwanensis TaxID=342230 RepID=A0A9W6VGN8_9PSEU|nr:iron-sulfur protein [Amycolatopsis taiwanensis]